MAGRISCCLNLPRIDSNSSQSPKTTSHISWRRTEDETETRKNKRCRLVLGVAATVVIGTIHLADVATVEAVAMESTVKEVAVGSVPPRRWSDKRTCPPWLQNSLETIVPENLPRPSGHRRLELAGLAKGDAPSVGAVVTRVNRAGCFSV
ncbi:hypothetical protein AALP_AA6G258300 [Arabis alpina]|uniref:Uncharacterized protein n=1 Tax=Arabis alpina TaxID=50452 RepID=A0A087GRQ3_ARAAL|nr:hypothetical protein AALP_AA6G258300 [Arabis alpina]